MANKATHQSSSHKKMNITVFQNVCGHFLQISIKVLGIIEVIELPHFSLPARCQNGGPSLFRVKTGTSYLIGWIMIHCCADFGGEGAHPGRPRGSQLGRKKNSFAENVIKLFVNLKKWSNMNWFASQDERIYYLFSYRDFQETGFSWVRVEKFQRNAFHWQDNTLVWTSENFKYLYAQS